MASKVAVPACCVVTGACGLVGRRLVEMLAAGGCKRVVAFDISGKPSDAPTVDNIEWVRGDLRAYEDVENALRGAECVFHIGALVGPYYPDEEYRKVNYVGTVNVVDACRALGVRKIVMSSSPSTRMDGSSHHRCRGEELPMLAKGKFMVRYAETKAMGEMHCREACDGEKLLTVVVSPHQVYGPRDALFLASFLKNAKKMRIFGNGENEISMVYVDNYCHGLMLGAQALYPGSPVLGKYYVVTDGEYVKIWQAIDQAVVGVGEPSILAKAKVPFVVMFAIAWIIKLIGCVVQLLPFAREYVVKGKGMFKLNPYAVTMMTIDRSFDITLAKKDLGYEPLVPFEEAWRKTVQWYADNRDFWVPK